MSPNSKCLHKDQNPHAQPENDSLTKKAEAADKEPRAVGARESSAAEIQALLQQLGVSIDRLETALPPIGKLATVKQAASCLGISPRTIRTQLYLGRWPGYRVGRAVRVDPAEIRKLMKKGFLP